MPHPVLPDCAAPPADVPSTFTNAASFAALGGSTWAVLGPDGEFFADLDAPPTLKDLVRPTGSPQRLLEAQWDGRELLTVVLTDGQAATTLTAQRLSGRRDEAAQVLLAGQDGYGIENPYCLAGRHDPEAVLFAADLFDASSDFAENVGCLDYVVEVLESYWPLTQPQRHVIAELAGGWSGDVDELIASALTIAGDTAA